MTAFQHFLKLLNDKKELKLILVASRGHLSRSDLSALVDYLESDNHEFEISLQISDPTEQPELLELHLSLIHI